MITQASRCAPQASCDTECATDSCCETDFAFTPEQCDELAKLAKALAHPARVRILTQIMAYDGCVCGDLVEASGLAQSTVSQHIAVLKEAGLVCGEAEGAKRCYCIVPNALRSLRVLVSQL